MHIDGTVEDIRFRNDESGWTVAVLDCGGEPITVTGKMPKVSPGDTVSAEGELVIHPQFGTQFKIISANVSTPKNEYGIVKFLASGLLPYCGEKTAAKLVDKFGENTLTIMENSPETVAKSIKGITLKKAQAMRDVLADLSCQRETITFLANYAVSVNLALKLYELYGENTIETVKRNPYILIEDVDGVGFVTADKIAQSMGIEADSDFRIRAGITYALKSTCDKDGNTYLPEEELLPRVKQLLQVSDDDKIAAALDSLRIDRRVVCVDGNVMLKRLYRAEKTAATELVKIVDKSNMLAVDVAPLVERYQTINSIRLNDAQQTAVKNAICSGVSIITGGPGTGKTTIIKCILYVLDTLGLKPLLLAPTGRAAKRITESCGKDAFTIHRALSAVNDASCFEENAVIVDEFSMVDIFLFKRLLDALSDESKLIVVGDADQLPSVGAGNVLRDLIDSGAVPVTRLEYIYRQGNESMITFNAHEINAGRMPKLNLKDGDFYFFKQRDAKSVADMTVELATSRITRFCGIEPSRIQVVGALKNGEAGVKALNVRLQKSLNGAATEYAEVGDDKFYKGDRVMHVVNNYDLAWTREGLTGKGVFNGDIGVVAAVRADGDIEVEFEDGRHVIYQNAMRRELILSYAITVHKSQGCEFDAIVMPIVSGAPLIMTRNLLYTAITRAKKLAVLVGDEFNIKRMVENNYVATRYSLLKEFIAKTKVGFSLLYGDGETADTE